MATVSASEIIRLSLLFFIAFLLSSGLRSGGELLGIPLQNSGGLRAGDGGQGRQGVPAAALEPGRQGNTAAGTITIMAAMPVGIKACTNPEAFSGGDDEEDDSSLRRHTVAMGRDHITRFRAGNFGQGLIDVYLKTLNQ